MSDETLPKPPLDPRFELADELRRLASWIDGACRELDRQRRTLAAFARYDEDANPSRLLDCIAGNVGLALDLLRRETERRSREVGAEAFADSLRADEEVQP